MELYYDITSTYCMKLEDEDLIRMLKARVDIEDWKQVKEWVEKNINCEFDEDEIQIYDYELSDYYLEDEDNKIIEEFKENKDENIVLNGQISLLE